MFSQTSLELRFSLGNEGKDGKNLSSQTWPGTPRRPSSRHPRPPESKFRKDFLALVNFFQGFQGFIWEVKSIRKIPAPIKIKSALPHQKNEEFYGHGGFPAERTQILGAHKIGAAISGPRIADKNFMDTRIFLNLGLRP